MEISKNGSIYTRNFLKEENGLTPCSEDLLYTICVDKVKVNAESYPSDVR